MTGQKDSLSPLTENIKCSPMKIMHTRIQLGIIYFDNLSFLLLFFFCDCFAIAELMMKAASIFSFDSLQCCIFLFRGGYLKRAMNAKYSKLEGHVCG